MEDIMSVYTVSVEKDGKFYVTPHLGGNDPREGMTQACEYAWEYKPGSPLLGREVVVLASSARSAKSRSAGFLKKPPPREEKLSLRQQAQRARRVREKLAAL